MSERRGSRSSTTGWATCARSRRRSSTSAPTADDHQRPGDGPRRRRPDPARRRRLPAGDGADPRARARRADRRAARGRRADPRHLPRPAAALRLDHRARRRRRARPARRARSTELDAGGLKVPHIGWSPVRWERDSRLTEGIETETPVLLRPLLRAAARAPTTCSAAPTTARASPARPSATTSSASSSTPRSRAPPGLRLLSNFAGDLRRGASRRVILYPAIDIRGGQAVRLLQGDYERETAYDADPVDAAPRWAGEGAEFLHVVDLDGASAGEPRNLDAVRRIAAAVDVPDPGRRRPARRRRRSRRCSRPGAERVVIGTAALRDPEFLDAMVAEPRRPGRRLGRRPRRQGRARGLDRGQRAETRPRPSPS